jgi:hypothetical protein
MPKTLQFRRDTTANLAAVTGSVGELFVDTDKDTVVVMDGSTAGGKPLATEDYANTGIILAQAAFNQGNSTATVANTDYTTISVSQGTYGNATVIPVITVSANGRIISIANTDVSSGGGGGGATITDDTSTNETRYVVFTNATTGTMSVANTSSTKAYFNPSTGTLSATVFNSLSDENQKTNITVIGDALNIVENLKGVTFNYKETGSPSAGLIAQDVEKYLPQLVNTNENGKTLNYDGVIGILVEAVKELSTKVKELENK